MSITATVLRRQGYTWAEIAERLQFNDAEAAKWSAMKVVETKGLDPDEMRPEEQ